MRRIRVIITALSALSAAGAVAAATQVTSLAPPDRTEICGGTGSATAGRYAVMNNVWGATTAQCLTVDDETGAFEVSSADHGNEANVAAYPMIYAGCHWGRCTADSGMPVRVDRIRRATSDWTFGREGVSGAWDATYDLWFHTTADVDRSPDGAELMIWLDHTGAADPGGTVVARDVAIAGATWDVWYARWAWHHVAYVRTSPTSSVRGLDLHAFIREAVGRGYVDDRWHLSGVEAGFELRRGGVGLRSEEFSVTVESAGAGRGP
ncbi:GH12 family glycosyl hydrolase domain-containing protein [Phytohabitans rumicis]|uniref:GH12 family glycosyl hydrolase domain-containing protein n=1 Tax=Phytohabitans rumicis TaxID=1076125 RepID=UPI0015643D2F|nr:glycoside hydrolase [Phytohabitans rumicis]